MLFLADSNGKYDEIAQESGCEVGQLITPLTRYKNHGLKFGIDNGAFKDFDSKSFRTLLERELPNREQCTPTRYEFFEALNVDSFDGTGLSRYTHMREALKAPNLFKNLGILGDNH